MAIKDTTKKPFIEDRDENVFIGIDLPFRKSEGMDGWFASTTDTISAVKNNIRNLLQTHRGERLMQPFIGMNLRTYLFEPITQDTELIIQNDIVDTFSTWLPFVEIKDIKISFSNPEESNQMNIFLDFNIKQDPNTLESIEVIITGGE